MVLASVVQLVVRLRRHAAGEAIQLADSRVLNRPARRTRIVRLALAAALVAATVTAVVVAPTAEGRHFLAAQTVGVVVLDVSASIHLDTYYRIEHELESLSRTQKRFGLVLFSDVAYETLPPGTPASELRPFLRFFAPNAWAHTRADALGNLIPHSPWEQWFSGGTKISAGLLLAEEMLLEAQVRHGTVLLISDLDDDPSDFGPLTQVVSAYQQEGFTLQVVPLNPQPQNLNFFQSLLSQNQSVPTVQLPTTAKASGKLSLAGTFPAGLAAFVVIVLILLTLNEWWAEPLRWRRSTT